MWNDLTSLQGSSYLFIFHLSACLSVCPFVCLFVYPFVFCLITAMTIYLRVVQKFEQTFEEGICGFPTLPIIPLHKGSQEIALVEPDSQVIHQCHSPML